MIDPAVLRSAGFIAILLVAAGRSSLAQDFEEAVEVPVNANMFELHETNFDQWVFGNQGRSGSAKQQLDSLLMLSIGELDRSCTLTESQRKKLMLAGRGDIKRFLDRVAEARKVFDRLRHDQNNINTIFQETQPLAATLRAGLFGPDSMFYKTIKSTLEADQSERYKKVLYEKAMFRHRARVRLAITNLDQSIGLTAEQRQKLIDVVLQETKPSDKPAGQYESQVVLLKIAKISEAKIKPILDEPRWKAMRQQMEQAKTLEQFFKQNGFLDDPKADSNDKPAQIKND